MGQRFAALALCLCLLPSSLASAAEKIRVAYVSPSPSHSAFWIAKEARLFDKYGLEAEILLLTGSPRLVQALIAGDVDFAFVGITAVIRARVSGADTLILGASTNTPTQKLLVLPQSGVRQVRDLKGKTVGVSQYGSEADVFARLVVKAAGLTPDRDVAIIQLGGYPQVLAALIARKIDVGVLGSLAVVAGSKAGAVALADSQSVKASSPSGILAATQRTIQRKRETVKKLMQVYVEAIHYFKLNPAGTVPILQKYMGAIPKDDAMFLYREYVDLLNPLPVPDETGFQTILDRETDPKTREFKPSDFIDLSFLDEMARSGFVKRLYSREIKGSRE